MANDNPDKESSEEEVKVVAVDTDDLDEFNDLLQGRAEVEAPEEESDEEEIEDSEESEDSEEEEIEDDPEEDADSAEQEEEEESEDSEEEPEEKPKPKKKTAQERINEITAKYREAERERDVLRGRLEEIERRERVQEDTEDGSAEQAQTEGPVAPTPEDTNEDGSPKYPLGEFDPNFIQDVVDFRFEQREAAAQLEREKTAERQAVEDARNELDEIWQVRVSEARDNYDDFNESVQSLEDTFKSIDPAYGQYLGDTIMQSEYGADILYHLSNNLDEAREIVDSGATNATLALGRLEAKFASEKVQEEAPQQRVTKAKKPPKKPTRGAGGKFAVADDTDDLDAFADKFFDN